MLENYNFTLNNLNQVLNLTVLGQKEAVCKVTILDDTIYEDDEYFRVVLSNPLSDLNKTAKLGKYKEVTIKITNENDSKFLN